MGGSSSPPGAFSLEVSSPHPRDPKRFLLKFCHLPMVDRHAGAVPWVCSRSSLLLSLGLGFPSIKWERGGLDNLPENLHL